MTSATPTRTAKAGSSPDRAVDALACWSDRTIRFASRTTRSAGRRVVDESHSARDTPTTVDDMREVTLVDGPLNGRTMRVSPGIFRIDTSSTIDDGHAYRPREKNATEWHYESVAYRDAR